MEIAFSSSGFGLGCGPGPGIGEGSGPGPGIGEGSGPGPGMRKRILKDLDSGMTEAATAQKWTVSISFIAKLKRRVRETGSLEPIKPKTGPKPKLQPHYELLQHIVAKTPDATLEEIREQLPVQVCTQRRPASPASCLRRRRCPGPRPGGCRLDGDFDVP